VGGACSFFSGMASIGWDRSERKATGSLQYIFRGEDLEEGAVGYQGGRPLKGRFFLRAPCSAKKVIIESFCVGNEGH